MAPQTIKINTSGAGDFFSSVLGKRIDERTYSDFMAEYDSRVLPDDDLTVVLTTEGGDMTYSVLIANVVANHKGKTIALVPRYAFSGGTVIALMCDEIHLLPNASLGPIDLLVYVPIKSVIPTMQKYKDTNWFCGTVHALLDSCQADYVRKLRGLLALKYDERAVCKVLEFFYFEFNHNTPLFQRDMPAFMAQKVKTVDRRPDDVQTTAATAAAMMMGGGAAGGGFMDMFNKLRGGGGLQELAPSSHRQLIAKSLSSSSSTSDVDDDYK